MSDVEPDTEGDNDEKNHESAHQELLNAAENLSNLADWCENNFEEADPENSSDGESEDPSHHHLYGAETIRFTGQCAIQAIRAFSYNMSILANCLSQRMDKIDQEAETMTDHVGWLLIESRLYETKTAFDNFKQFTAGRPLIPEQNELNVGDQEEEGVEWKPYCRKSIDFSALDGVGCGRTCLMERADVMRRQNSLNQRRHSQKFASISSITSRVKLTDKAPDRIHTLGKKVEMPKVPQMPIKQLSLSELPAPPEPDDAQHEEGEEMTLMPLPQISDIRLSILPPMPDADLALEDDFSNILQSMQKLEEEISRSIEQLDKL